MGNCFNCGEKAGKWGSGLYFPENKLKDSLLQMGISDSKVNEMGDKDVLCEKCGNKVFCRNAVKVYKFYESTLLPDEFEKILRSGENWIAIAKAELEATKDSLPKKNTPAVSGSPVGNTSISVSSLPNKASTRITTAADLTRLTESRHDETKANWNKNGVVQYKDDNIAILQRMWGSQVQFIVACSQVTSEGYRLVAIDEGKSGGQASGGFTGGVNAYFYFQKMDYVR